MRPGLGRCWRESELTHNKLECCLFCAVKNKGTEKVFIRSVVHILYRHFSSNYAVIKMCGAFIIVFVMTHMILNSSSLWIYQ